MKQEENSQGEEFQENELFSSVFDRYAPALFGIAVRLVRSEELAGQIVVNTLAKLWPQVQGSQPFLPEIFFEKALQSLRVQAAEIISSGDSQHKHPAGTFDFLEYLIAHQSAADRGAEASLLKVIRGIDEKNLKVLDLSFFQGMKQEEIEHAIDIPIGSVKPRLRRTIREMRAILIPVKSGN